MDIYLLLSMTINGVTPLYAIIDRLNIGKNDKGTGT